MYSEGQIAKIAHLQDRPNQAHSNPLNCGNPAGFMNVSGIGKFFGVQFEFVCGGHTRGTWVSSFSWLLLLCFSWGESDGWPNIRDGECSFSAELGTRQFWLSR
jgi:hypothetical protein